MLTHPHTPSTSIRQDNVPSPVTGTAPFHTSTAKVVAGVTATVQFLALAVLAEVVAGNHAILSFGTPTELDHAMAIPVAAT